MAANQTSFKPGHDARRYIKPNTGTTEFYAKMGQLFRDHCPEALDYALDVMRNPESHPKLRWAACVEILNRGAGKPVDRTVITSIDQGTTIDPANMTDQELMKLIETTAKSNVIEGEFTEGQ